MVYAASAIQHSQQLQNKSIYSVKQLACPFQSVAHLHILPIYFDFGVTRNTNKAMMKINSTTKATIEILCVAFG